MAEETETFPNFVSRDGSPSIDDIGVQIAVTPGAHTLGEPLVVRGVYKIGAELIRKSQGAPLGRVILILFRRDEPDLWAGPALDTSNIAPEPTEPGEAIGPGARQGGYFNLDVSAMYRKFVDGGRYWILAAMGDYVSKRIEFSIEAPKEEKA